MTKLLRFLSVTLFSCWLGFLNLYAIPGNPIPNSTAPNLALTPILPFPSVNDSIAPTAVCQDVTVYVDAAGTNIDPSVLDGGSTDNCGSISFTSDTTIGCSTALNFYVVDTSGTYAPDTTTGTTVVLADDANSPNLPIGFDFEFFGVTYNDFVIASNGLIGFGITTPAPNIASSGCCLGQSLPNPATLNNIVGFAWEDLSPNLGGTISYVTIGTAPNRKLIMTFDAIRFFNGSGSVTSQVQLHESTNRIEIHTTDITTGGVNQGLTIGIENSNGTLGYTDPGFNQTTQNGTIKTNDYVAFVPAAGVQLTVTDSSGNSSNCTATVLILDTIAPVAVCQNITVQLDTLNTASITASNIDGGSTDNCGITYMAADSISFDCSSPISNTVTLTLADNGGNSSTCTATVTIQDTIAPTLTCQDVTLNLDVNGLYTLTTAEIVTASSDNCGIDSLILSASSFTCADSGTFAVTATATDLYGTTGSCTVNVTLADVTAPLAVCNDLSVTLDATGQATLNLADITAGSVDNCGIDSLALDVTEINCNTTLNSYAVIDSGTFSLITGADTTVSIGDDENSVDLPIGFDFVFFDSTYNNFNIASNGLIGFNLPVPGSSLTETGCCIGQVIPNTAVLNNVIAFAWEDLSPNLGGTISYFTSGTAPNRILVMDFDGIAFFNGSGTVTCQVQLHETSNHIEIHTTSIVTGGVNQGLTVGIENVDGTRGYTQSGFNRTTANGTLKTNDFVAFYPATEVNVTAIDGAGNTSTCVANIIYTEVADTVAPSMVCQDITVQLDTANQATIAALDIDGGTTDNCEVDTLFVSQTGFDCSSVGAVSVILTGIDRDGNLDSCSATVTVVDTMAPVLTCPANISVGTDAGNCSAVVTYTVSNSDNCSATLAQTTGLGTGSVFPNGITTESYTLTDVSGNIDTCSFTVTVTDSENPVAVCQDISVYLDANGDAAITTTSIDGGSTDNCGIATSIVTTSAFTCAAVGANTVSLSVIDTVGGLDSCSATVTVLDTIAPVADCQNLFVILDANGTGSITNTDADDGSTDACGIASIIAADTSFDCTDAGTFVMDTLTLTDVNGNISTCTFTVQVLDFRAPTASCQTATVYLDAAGSASITAADIDNGSTDNCGISTIQISDSAFTCSDLGGNSVTLTVTDANGTSGTCASTVTVVDSTAPTAVCQDVTLNLDATGSATLAIVDVEAGSTDNCGLSASSLDLTTFTCTELGTNTATLTVTDSSGNTNSCTSTITVNDTLLPTAACTDISVYLDASGQATADPAVVGSGSADNCGIDSVSLSVSNFTCADVGANTVTLIVWDGSGDTASCNSTITVADTLAPTTVCTDVTVYLDATGQASTDASTVGGTSSDNCSLDSLNLATTSFSCADIGANTVGFTAWDASGNMGTCDVTITVADTIAPTVSCEDFTLYLDNSGNGTVTGMNVTSGPPTDNCALMGGLVLSQSSFVQADTGQNSVTVTVTDSSGNTSSCVSVVTVIDSFFVGIPDALSADGFEFDAYPNPTQGDLFVEIHCETCVPGTATELRLISLTGQVLYRESMELFTGELSSQIDMREYAQGTYILSVHQEGRSLSRRIVKY